MRRTPHVRHRHKYAANALPDHRWFRFRGPDGRVVATATTLAEFSRIVRDIDDSILDHPLAHGAFSRWFLGTIQDRSLASAGGPIERNVLARRAADVLHARELLLDEVDSRYLTSL